MTETERAVDDAEGARGQDGKPRRPRVPGRLSRLVPGWVPRRAALDELGVLVVLGLLVVGIGIPYSDFLDSDNLLSTAHNSVYISLMACGMVYALAMREVDLSVGGSYAMCLIAGALRWPTASRSPICRWTTRSSRSRAVTWGACRSPSGCCSWWSWSSRWCSPAPASGPGCGRVQRNPRRAYARSGPRPVRADQGYELQAIAACIIGGTPLAGGRGSVVGAVAGAVILSVVAAGLVFFEVPINWTSFATGGVILVAVADSALRRTGRRRK